MTLDLNDPVLAQALNRLIEQKVDARIAALVPLRGYGTVASVDGGGFVSVYLVGSASATAQVRCEPLNMPIVGDRVRVATVGADRYVEAVYGTGVGDQHLRLHSITSASDHSGSITDAQHGTRTQSPAHAHAHLSGVGANDHHAQAHNHSNALDGTAIAPTSVNLNSVVMLDTDGVTQFARLFAALEMDSAVSPAQIVANQNNYAPGATARAAHMWRLSTDATIRTITGISNAQTNGERHLLMNINTATAITLAHQDAGSTDVNRFIGPNSASVTLRPGGWVEVIYDGTTARWRIMGA